VKSDAEASRSAVRGRVLPTGAFAPDAGQVPLLPGTRGLWWVQDAAPALPRTPAGDYRQRGRRSLRAAPGKTAQLAFAGAKVTAVDARPIGLARVRENLARLSLHADTVAADATEWQGGTFDAVLVDAPCSSPARSAPP